MRELHKTADEEKALDAAHKEWSKPVGGERVYDEHLLRIYPDDFTPNDEPLFAGAQSPPFTQLAQRLFEPLLSHLSEET